METKEAPAKYRILVPLGEGKKETLLQLALALARQEGGEVLILRVISPGQRSPEEALSRWAADLEETYGVPVQVEVQVSSDVSRRILQVANEEECDLILLGWRGYTSSRRAVLGRVLDPVVRDAPCDIMVVRRDELVEVKRILLPTAGGPHANRAAKIALALAREYGARITALYVCRFGATTEDEAEGRERIAHTFADLKTGDLVESKIKVASGVVKGILEEAESHELILLGASEESIFDQFLFGAFPERVASHSPKTVIMVKRYKGLAIFWLYRLWRGLTTVFPTLTDEDKLVVYRDLRRRARGDVDYFVMISLASIIVTLGLLLNSAPIIIGAMLVAPLMAPILAVSLGIAQGDIRLLRYALESILKGIILAIIIAALLTLISPLAELTDEIVARIRPTFIDLLVALASGAAGAYAVARRDVSEALPGVAISAALVPPLGVGGIGMAMGRPEVAGGGFLLFATNLTAIVLIGAITFLLLGFHPAMERRERRLYLHRGLLLSLVLLLLTAIPLGVFFLRAVQSSQEENLVGRALERRLNEMEGVSLAHFEIEHKGSEASVVVTLYAERELTPLELVQLKEAASKAMAGPTAFKFITLPVIEIR